MSNEIIKQEGVTPPAIPTDLDIERDFRRRILAVKRSISPVRNNNKVDFTGTKFNYADIGAINDAIEDILHENGMYIHSFMRTDLDDVLEIRIVDSETGHYINTLQKLIYIKGSKSDMRNYGGAQTTARRYGLILLLNLSCEDDDGVNAEKRAAAEEARKSQQQEITKKMFNQTPADPVTPSVRDFNDYCDETRYLWACKSPFAIQKNDKLAKRIEIAVTNDFKDKSEDDVKAMIAWLKSVEG